jgi:CBS domain containing-hemolysin-like protein
MLTWIAIVITLLFVAFFAGVDVAFASANKLSIELKKKQGRSSGIILSYFMDHPSRFIGTTLIGFNIFFVLFGLLSEQVFLPLSIKLINTFQWPAGWVIALKIFVEILSPPL